MLSIVTMGLEYNECFQYNQIEKKQSMKPHNVVNHLWSLGGLLGVKKVNFFFLMMIIRIYQVSRGCGGYLGNNRDWH